MITLISCLDEIQEAFPEIVVAYEQFKSILYRNVYWFRRTLSRLRKQGTEIPRKRNRKSYSCAQEILNQEPKASIRHLSQQVKVSVGACHKLRKGLHLFPYRSKIKTSIPQIMALLVVCIVFE